MVEQFGFDRPIYVLANTVQEKSYDGGISQSKTGLKRFLLLETSVSVERTAMLFCCGPVQPRLSGFIYKAGETGISG